MESTTFEPAGTLSISEVIKLPPSSFSFYSNNSGTPLIVINEKGFSYKGELIDDAGEVYKLFKQFLVESQNK